LLTLSVFYAVLFWDTGSIPIWWADFSIGTKRFRISLHTFDHREAARWEKLRIGEAQNHGGLLPRKTAKLTVTEAAEQYS
jgi:hypothetical protein